MSIKPASLTDGYNVMGILISQDGVVPHVSRTPDPNDINFIEAGNFGHVDKYHEVK